MTRKMQPTPAQRKYLEAVRKRNSPLVRSAQPAAWATIRACERAGWTAVGGNGNPRLTFLGRDALTQTPTARLSVREIGRVG